MAADLAHALLGVLSVKKDNSICKIAITKIDTNSRLKKQNMIV